MIETFMIGLRLNKYDTGESGGVGAGARQAVRFARFGWGCLK